MSRTHTTLTSLFTDIADSIREKTGDTESIVADNFPTEIANIPSGADLHEYFNYEPESIEDTNSWYTKNFLIKYPETVKMPSSATSANRLLYNIKTPFRVPKLIGGENVTDFKQCYMSSTSVKNDTIDLSGLDTSSATTLDQMFNGCSNVKNLDVSMLNTSNVTNVYQLFYGMSKLEKMDLTNLDFSHTRSGTSQNGNVFQNCYLLTEVKCPILLANHNYSLADWFQNCYSLVKVIIPCNFVAKYYSTFTNCYHMNGTVNATYNPQGLKDGRIYVPDDLVDSYKRASGWSTYADQILPISQLPTE